MSKFNYQLFSFFLFFIIASCSSNKSYNTDNENIIIKKNVVEKIQQRIENEILVCAHRAYHKFAPENSISSIKKAIEATIDIVEIDVNMTKDSVLVLMHDNKIDRTTNGKGYVSDFTFNELRKFNLKINDSVTEHKIPTLSEALSIAKDKIILNLDIKHVDLKILYQQLKINGMQNDVFSFIWDKNNIDKILVIDATYAVLPLVNNRSEMIYYAENIQSKLQHFDENTLNFKNMKWAKDNGIIVFMNSLWKVDDQFIKNQTYEMDKIIALRPAIIQTDHPLLLVNYLKSKNLHR